MVHKQKCSPTHYLILIKIWPPPPITHFLYWLGENISHKCCCVNDWVNQSFNNIKSFRRVLLFDYESMTWVFNNLTYFLYNNYYTTMMQCMMHQQEQCIPYCLLKIWKLGRKAYSSALVVGRPTLQKNSRRMKTCSSPLVQVLWSGSRHLQHRYEFFLHYFNSTGSYKM